MKRYPTFMNWKTILLRCQHSPKLIYRFNAISIKIQTAFFFFFCRNEQADPKIHMEMQGTQKSQHTVDKEKQNWRAHTF